MELDKIGKFLSSLRKQKGLTQEQLGEVIGVSNKTISRWENGTYLPPVEMLLELSNFYGVSLNEILSGELIQTQEDYKEKAEQNLQKALAASVFTKHDQYLYFRNKWLKDHLFEHILYPIFIVALIVLGAVCQISWLHVFSLIFAVVISVIERNFYRAYLEKHLYDGSGNPVVDDLK